MQQYVIKQLKVSLALIAAHGEKKALEQALLNYFSAVLTVKEVKQLQYKYLKRSLDLRKKVEAAFVYKLALLNVDALAANKLNKLLNSNLLMQESENYTWEQVKARLQKLEASSAKLEGQARPIVVGFGPAGIYAALILAAAGLKPLIIERGKPVDERLQDFSKFQETGILDPNSNAQFGEGGAGCFSDGKLGTRIKDGLLGLVLDILVAHGADKDILWRQNPHIGTDKLRPLLKLIRKQIIAMGGEIRFNTQLLDFTIEDGALQAISVVDLAAKSESEASYEIPCTHLVLAPGHSARDLYRLLAAKQQTLSPKPFAVGFRIEQSQAAVDRVQYGKQYEKLLRELVGAAEYHLACKVEAAGKERRVYTFCMCPGGEVIAGASNTNSLCVNGMSYQDRAGENANAAVICAVAPEDLGNDIFAGMEFQEAIEQQAYNLTGSYAAPLSTVYDFVNNVLDAKQQAELFSQTDYAENLAAVQADKDLLAYCLQAIKSSYKPATKAVNLSKLYPRFINEALAKGILQLNRHMLCFAPKQACLLAPETRTSAPLRIERDKDTFVALACKGLYPCGEGAGYAGGISSAAVDGIKVAKALIADLLKLDLADDLSSK